MRKFLTLAEFRKAFPKQDHPKGYTFKTLDRPIVRATLAPVIKAGDEEGSRVLRFTISTDTVDRMGDTIAVDGWDLKAFKKNPVVLWAHDSTQLPVGKASNITVEDGKLKADAEFASADLNPLADQVLRMYQQGFLSAVSVGFVPHKWAWVEDKDRPWGIEFMEQELLEFSAVPVPANPEALVEDALVPPEAKDNESAAVARRHAQRSRTIALHAAA